MASGPYFAVITIAAVSSPGAEVGGDELIPWEWPAGRRGPTRRRRR